MSGRKRAARSSVTCKEKACKERYLLLAMALGYGRTVGASVHSGDATSGALTGNRRLRYATGTQPDGRQSGEPLAALLGGTWPATLRLPNTDGGEMRPGMAYHQNIGEWHGKELVDRNGERIGKLEDVYVDVETNEPMFGTVKEGLIGRHLTFVPLAGITIGPDSLQVPVSKEQVKDAPNIELHGDELSRADESTLYHHYQLNYTPPDTERGRRLARR
jgi:hypothetical protein